MDEEKDAVDAYYRVYDRLIDIGGDALHRDGDLMNDLAKLFAAAKMFDKEHVVVGHVLREVIER